MTWPWNLLLAIPVYMVGCMGAAWLFGSMAVIGRGE